MTTYPEIIAGYEAATKILASHPVKIDHPGRSFQPFPSDPIAMMAAFPPAYSVELMVLSEGVNVIRNGRYGIDDEMTFVDYPCDTTAEDFEQKLCAVLVPVVEEQLRRAAAKKTADRAEHGSTATYEARDAIKRIS